jgi:MFS family permease
MINRPLHWPAWSALRSKRGFQLLLLSLATASAFLARTSLGPLQETMRVALALSDSQMALLQGPPLALGMITTVPFGILIDRRSRVRLIWIFASLGLLASGFGATASSVAVLFAARCLTGLSAAAMFTTVLSLLADWYPPDQRGRATMAVSFGGAVGLSGAFALGGFLLALIGPGANSWRWAMMGLSLPMIACLLCIGAMQEPARTGSIVKDLAPRDVYAALWRYRATMLPLIIGFALVAGIADGAALIWAAPALSRTFHLTPDRGGAIMASVLLTTGLVSPMLGGVLADMGQRIGGPYRTVTTLSGLLFLSIPSGLFALVPGIAPATVALVVFLVSGSSFQVAVTALTTIIFPNELRASCLALMLGIAYLFAFGVAPLLVSQLSVTLGGEDMIGKSLAVICVASSFIAAVIFWFGRRPFRGPSVQGPGTQHLQHCTAWSSYK